VAVRCASPGARRVTRIGRSASTPSRFVFGGAQFVSPDARDGFAHGRLVASGVRFVSTQARFVFTDARSVAPGVRFQASGVRFVSIQGRVPSTDAPFDARLRSDDDQFRTPGAPTVLIAARFGTAGDAWPAVP
jgi:hypothetical protein